MPRLGLKVDAVPGSLNQHRVEISAVGVFTFNVSFDLSNLLDPVKH